MSFERYKKKQCATRQERKERFVRFVQGIDKREEKVTKVNQNYAHKGIHFSVSQNKEPLF